MNNTLKTIMTSAWAMYKAAGCKTRAEFGLALKAAWAKTKTKKEYKNVLVAEFNCFNARRYSDPWVAIVNQKGSFDFSQKVGAYTGGRNTGDAGDLVVFAPVDGQVYGYGQKDRRGANTEITFAVFANGVFVDCDCLGRAKKAA